MIEKQAGHGNTVGNQTKTVAMTFQGVLFSTASFSASGLNH
jgi:hypothetical protein